MKTLIYWWLGVLILTSCQSKNDQTQNSTSSDKPQEVKKTQEDEQPEYVKSITQEKIKATLQDYCEKLSNEAYEAAIRDNFSPKVGQYIGMRQVTPDQIATEVDRFLSQKKQVRYQVDLDQLKVTGYLATVPLSFSWEGYYAKVLLELSFDANYKIAFYKEAKVFDKSLVQFVQRKCYESVNDCEKDSSGCSYYAIEYPEIIQAPAYLKDKLMDNEGGCSPDSLKKYLKGFMELCLPVDGMGEVCWMDLHTYIKESKYLITVETVTSMLQGRPRVDYMIRTEHYDKRTGKSIDLADLLIGNALEDFEEVAFQTIVGEEHTQCRDQFSLSHAFRVLDKGIELCYGYGYYAEARSSCIPVEQSDFLIPYEKFKYIIRKDGLLKDKIRE